MGKISNYNLVIFNNPSLLTKNNIEIDNWLFEINMEGYDKISNYYNYLNINYLI